MKHATKRTMNNWRHIYIQLIFFIFIIDANPPKLKCGTCGVVYKYNFKLKNFKLVRKKKTQKKKDEVTNTLNTLLEN